MLHALTRNNKHTYTHAHTHARTLHKALTARRNPKILVYFVSESRVITKARDQSTFKEASQYTHTRQATYERKNGTR